MDSHFASVTQGCCSTWPNQQFKYACTHTHTHTGIEPSPHTGAVQLTQMCSRMYSITASCLASELKRRPIGRDVTDEVTAWVTSSTLDGPLRAAGNYEVMDQHTLAPTHPHTHTHTHTSSICSSSWFLGRLAGLSISRSSSLRKLHTHQHESDKRAAALARILLCLIRREEKEKVSRSLWTRPNEEWSASSGGNNRVNTSYIKQTRGYTGKPTYVNAVTPHWRWNPVNRT